MTEEEKIIDTFNKMKYRTDDESKEYRKNVTDLELSIVYKWGMKKDIDNGVESKDMESIARTAYLILAEESERTLHKKLFKNKSIFEKVQKEVINYYCSQFLEVRKNKNNI